MKALLFYLIVRMFYNKKLNMARPFIPELPRVLNHIAWLCLGIGLFSFWGIRRAEWIESQGVAMPEAEQLRIGGADVWLFMAVVLFVIAQVFKKGNELQTESDLTV
jgi:hypothetical protein